MQYILIETETTFTTREVAVPVDAQALATAQVGALLPTQTVTDAVPGVRLYQCVSQTGVMEYKTLDGQPYTVTGGSFVVDPNPPVPAWDVPEVPVVPAPVQAPRRLTKLAYMNRFHDDELADIYTAAKTVVEIEVMLAKLNAATPDADGTSVDLNDPRTVGGVYALEAVGLIAAGRANEILA